MKLRVFAIVLMAVTAASAADDPLSPLDQWVGGVWQGDGKMVESRMSQAQPIHGTTRCTWSPEHVYVVCDQQALVGGQAQKQLSLYTYDAEAKKYRFATMSPAKAQVQTPDLSIDGDTWTYASSFEENGKTTRIRTVNTWRDKNTVDFRTEYSIDGAPWTLMGSGTNRRKK